MKKFMNWMLKEESGQGMVEYGLIIVLVALVAMAGLTGIGTQLFTKFTAVSTELAK